MGLLPPTLMSDHLVLRLRMHPAVPYMEREAIVDDIIPLRYPFIDTNGVKRSEVFVKTGQACLRLLADMYLC